MDDDQWITALRTSLVDSLLGSIISHGLTLVSEQEFTIRCKTVRPGHHVVYGQSYPMEAGLEPVGLVVGRIGPRMGDLFSRQPPGKWSCVAIELWMAPENNMVVCTVVKFA